MKFLTLTRFLCGYEDGKVVLNMGHVRAMKPWADGMTWLDFDSFEGHGTGLGVRETIPEILTMLGSNDDPSL